MAISRTTRPPAAILDASLVVGLCAKESNKYAAARAKIDQCVANGHEFFAPDLLVAEVLFALCSKLKSNALDQVRYDQATASFIKLMAGINPPPSGDASLVSRAQKIMGAYGCSHMSDSFYLALAEQLQSDRQATLVTFDEGMEKQAKANALTVTVDLLTVLKP